MSTKLKYLNILMIIIVVIALSSAYYVEYIMQIAACPLCIYQRFPYLILFMIAIIGLSSDKTMLWYYLFTTIPTSFLAAYHSGVERGIFQMSSFCKPLVSINSNLSADDFKRMLYNKPIGMCNKPAIKIFELSMAEWNFLLNIGLSILFILLIILIKKGNQSDA